MAADTVALVTGATAGIGLHTGVGLARAGMRVILAGRDPARTEAARRLVAERSGSQAVETALADFASLAAVRRLADSVISRHDRLEAHAPSRTECRCATFPRRWTRSGVGH